MNNTILINYFREYKSGSLEISEPVYDFMTHKYNMEPISPQKICDFWSTVFAIRHIEDLMGEQKISADSDPFIIFSNWFKNLYPLGSLMQKRLKEEKLRLYTDLHYELSPSLFDLYSESEIQKTTDFLATDIIEYPIIELYGYNMPTLSLSNGFFSKKKNYVEAHQYIYDIIKSNGTLIAYMPFLGKDEGYAFAYRFIKGTPISINGSMLTAVCNACMPVSWLHTHAFKEPFICTDYQQNAE